MSGGLAYIYNAQENLIESINQSTVFIEEPNKEDFDFLQKRILQHLQHTQSDQAMQILDHWEMSKSKFIKIYPKEYKAIKEKGNQTGKTAFIHPHKKNLWAI